MSAAYIQAFPGMGKSTIADKYEQVVDADFGVWRKEHTGGKHFWELTKEKTEALYRQFMGEVIIPALDEGKIVLTNEPGLSKYVPAGFPIHTVVPHPYFYARHLHGILKRTMEARPEDFDDSNSFIVKLCQNYEKWILGWSGGTLHKFRSYDNWIPLIEKYLN